MTKRFDLATLFLPFLGIGAMLLIWTTISTTVALDLPSPMKTWEESKQYILNPFFKDGEMNQGIGRFAFLSLVRVAKGFFLGHRDRNAAGISSGTLDFFPQDLRSGNPDLAADFSVGMAAAGVGYLQAIGARRDFYDRHLCHVADGD